MARRRDHDGRDRPGSDATAPARASSGRRHPACECGLAATDRVTGRTAGIRYAARGRRARGAIPDSVPPTADGPRHVASLILPGRPWGAGRLGGGSWVANGGSAAGDLVKAFDPADMRGWIASGLKRLPP